MKMLLIISVLLSCITNLLADPDSTIGYVCGKYVCDEELSEFEFIKPYKSNFYTLSFVEDTIPYLIGKDSLFKLNLCGDGYCMYYNPELLNNTGLVIFGDSRKNEVNIFYTGTIRSVDVYFIDDYNVVRVIENFESFGAPNVIKTKYMMYSMEDDTIKVLTLLSKCSTWLDSSSIELVDDFSFPEIHVHGIIDNQPVRFDISITEGGRTPISINNLWNGVNIIENESIVPKKYHYCKQN